MAGIEAKDRDCKGGLMKDEKFATIVFVILIGLVFAIYIHALVAAHNECDNGVGHVVKNWADWPVCLHNG
jgi:hypothetical protein